jgi:uncharacterized protein
MALTVALPGPKTSLEAPRMRTVDLRGPAGRLEALLNEGSADSPIAALVCHPHPLGGGNMHNKVVYRAAKVMNAPEWGFHWPVLRFNFRDAGRSEGSHDGSAESADVTAAMDWLHSEYGLPIVVAGFSFGAVMALVACCGRESTSRGSIRALVALGLPAHDYGHGFRSPSLSNCTLPKLFLSGDHDQFAPTKELELVVQSTADPKTWVLIPGADHSFTGKLEMMQEALATWLREQMQ